MITWVSEYSFLLSFNFAFYLWFHLPSILRGLQTTPQRLGNHRGFKTVFYPALKPPAKSLGTVSPPPGMGLTGGASFVFSELIVVDGATV